MDAIKNEVNQATRVLTGDRGGGSKGSCNFGVHFNDVVLNNPGVALLNLFPDPLLKGLANDGEEDVDHVL